MEALSPAGHLDGETTVTLSSSEAEFVAASQAGQDAVYLRVLLKGFGYIRYRNIGRSCFFYLDERKSY
jgi:hypothetical protein